MTIGVDVSRAFRANKTGIEWYAYHLMYALHALDVSNEYRFYTDREPPHGIDASLRSKIVVLKWPLAFLWTQGRLSLEMLLRPIDVLIIPASAMPIVHPRKTVAVMHDVGFLQFPDSKSRFEIWYLQWTSQYAIRHAWRLICVSEWTKKEITDRYRVSGDTIRVVSNGIDPEYYRTINIDEAEVILERFGIRKPFFLSVGRLDPRKNYTMLVQAFSQFWKKHPSYSLILAGPEGYAARETIDAIHEAQHNGISIQHLSWISEEDKRALFSSCEAFIFPSLYEGFGIPLLEAQGCRAPVIASRIPALIEISGNAALFFDPKNIQELIKVLSDFVAKKEDYSMHLKRGLENARTFSWMKTASLIHAICTEQ